MTEKTSARKPKQVKFETALQQLEALVTKIESGGLTLEESLQVFEQGIGLSKQCQAALKQAEQKIQILTEQNDQLEAFESPNE